MQTLLLALLGIQLVSLENIGIKYILKGHLCDSNLCNASSGEEKEAVTLFAYRTNTGRPRVGGKYEVEHFSISVHYICNIASI